MTETTDRVLVEPRLNVPRAQPEAYRALVQADDAATRGVDRSLAHLIKLRASQINGCAYCIDMHSKDARREGETEQRLYALDAWRETSFYTARERAALAYTESATLLHLTHVPDDVYQALERHFSTEEIGAVILLVALSSAFNRIAVSCRARAGSYRPEEAR